ncbi:xanthine dehydrogenase family protein molybdopterin-binding subunit [Novosphingobium sp. JCM 18896]|uniref:xanthine dehydrogenase family protein molybdopterin-binding subunit n=1 Tax=Novosphingobium sp. JCM 18896 TaxID=2989731 RepID=UPI0022217AE8|nr:molybdopterin cofactor-binding domain-containing protein [Novosphingobium sp. JCM 18896]MCW1430127.1 molybdopterin-dependent oxidoreductase [Novosphingobium sp. JCM 18896]
MKAPTNAAMTTDRRRFLAVCLAGTGGLTLGFPLLAPRTAMAAEATFRPNAFLAIGGDGTITATVPYAEMGQGAMTSIAMLAAEELAVAPAAIKTVLAPGDNKLYAHPVLGEQITGGSASLAGSWMPIRKAAAAARIMLVEAAARRWGVGAATCTVADGRVHHAASKRSLAYSELAQAAASVPVPADPPVKTGGFKVIGTAAPRVDSAAKVDGSAVFGLDVRRPGMVYAAVQASPVIGGKLGAVDDKPALAVAGVTQVVRLANAVAVVGRHTGAARKGLAMLEPHWDGGLTDLSTEALVKQADAALDRKGVTAATKGDVAKAFAGAASTFEADYRMPMLAHAAMEPLNCTVEVRDGACEIWVGSQVPGRARIDVAKALGLDEDRVKVNSYLIGGGFGRRLQSEWIVQAALIARQVKAPVKVVWSREEDTRQDAYRYHNHSRVRVALDAKGNPLAFDHRIVAPAIMLWFLPSLLWKDGVDVDATNAATGPYAFPNLMVDYVRNDPPDGLLVGNWRGVGETRNGFVVETVMDQLAAKAGVDPVEYRRRLLPPKSRIAVLLDRLAQETGWGKPLPAGTTRGVAIQSGFGSHMGLVAQVRMDGGKLKVERMTAVIDCGIAVNPNVVRQQIEGGLLFGLTAALYSNITIADGRVVESNFHDQPVVRMVNTPKIDVIIIENGNDPGGVGEPGTAIVAPAIANAVFAATGKPLHQLPLPASMVERV